MQQQQQIHTTQEGPPDNMSPVFSTPTDPSKPLDKQKDESHRTLDEDKVKEQQIGQFAVTQQPTGSNNRDYCTGTLSANVLTEKKKKRQRRCCCSNFDSDGSIHSGVSIPSFGSGGGGGSGGSCGS